MNSDTYYRALQHFCVTHGIERDIPSRVAKGKVEFKELEEAVAYGDPVAIKKEAGDILNVMADIIMLLHGEPLWVAYQKLEEAAARPHYIEMARKVDEDAGAE